MHAHARRPSRRIVPRPPLFRSGSFSAAPERDVPSSLPGSRPVPFVRQPARRRACAREVHWGASRVAWEASWNDWEWGIGVNLWSVIHGIKVFTPLMLAQKTECHIINTPSLGGTGLRSCVTNRLRGPRKCWPAQPHSRPPARRACLPANWPTSFSMRSGKNSSTSFLIPNIRKSSNSGRTSCSALKIR